MSGSRGFCPRCGEALARGEGWPAPQERASRHADLCTNCYFEDFELVSVPEQLRVRVCARCGAIARGEHWEDVGADDYTDIAIVEIEDALQVHRDAEAVTWSVDPEHHGPNELDLHLHVSADVHGRSIIEEHTVSVRISRETCTRCGRIAGDSFAGTVQVRADGRTPSGEETDRAISISHEVVEELRETGNRTAFISEVIERPEGLDIRVSTTSIGAKIAARLTDEHGGRYESSERLVTENEEGERVYRVAYAVRLPRFRRGDIIDPKDDTGPILVRSARERVRGRRLATGEDVTLEESQVSVAELVGTIADSRETTVVTVEDERAVQLLDPDTAEAITVSRPLDVSVETDTLPVVKTPDGVYIVPGDEGNGGESS